MSYVALGWSASSVTEAIAKGAQEAAATAGRTVKHHDKLQMCDSDADCTSGPGHYCCRYKTHKAADKSYTLWASSCLGSRSQCEAINAEQDCERKGGTSKDGRCLNDTGDVIGGTVQYDPANLPDPATISDPVARQAIQSAKGGQPAGDGKPGDKTLMYIAGAAVVVGGLAFLLGRASE